jgi:hypothetical protein
MRHTRPCIVFGLLQLACGGLVDSGTSSCGNKCASSQTGGSTSANAQAGGATTGGSSSAGAAGCVNRDWHYLPGDTFSQDLSLGFNQFPECVPTCNAQSDSVELLPAGYCTNEPSCSAMILIPDRPDAGYGSWHYYVCSCSSGNWSCKGATGA